MFSESPSNYKLMAKLLISAQVSISFGALVLYNYYIQQSVSKYNTNLINIQSIYHHNANFLIFKYRCLSQFQQY